MVKIDVEVLSEADVKAKYIDPSLKKAGWNEMTQIRREVSFTDGRIIVKKKGTTRKKRKASDYVLSYKPNIPLAIIEAKKSSLPVGAGMQQGIDYGEILDIPFIYTSNGENFVEFDRFTATESIIPLHKFPTPEELWERYLVGKNLKDKELNLITEAYFYTKGTKKPRYYQRIAINRTIEAITKGQKRILLVMATGTGKTYTAFQIIWRLWKAKEKKRILYLADRNILIDQTITGDFRYFEDKMIKISRSNISKAHEIYLGLYQSMTGAEDWQQIFKQYSPDFFDLIVVDECHRGSAREDSAWREILEYFSSATQIGLTATSKETEDVSNINYFGEPIYIYSLKQGIEDGFLAPYKVIRYVLDKDILGFRPVIGQLDRYGNLIDDREYTAKDFDRTLVLSDRTKKVAKAISDYMKENDRYMKAIVFCENIEHATDMRSCLVNENKDLVKINSKYIMKITGDDKEGKNQLDNFIDPKEKYPVIVTTSKLLTTGVDAKTCKLIVLDSNINSMTEFKQIIGRGTRIDEEYGKSWFTILDFRGATRLFADPDFDGDPEPIYEPDEGDDGTDPENPNPEPSSDGTEGEPTGTGPEDPIIKPRVKPEKYYVDNCTVTIINKTVQILDANGKLMTETFESYSKNTLKKQFRTLEDFLNVWNKLNRRQLIIDELENMGIDFEALKEEIGTDLDEFDIICHLAFDTKPITKKERIRKVKNNYLKKYSGQAREILEMLLDKYAEENVKVFEDISTLRLPQFEKFGTLPKIMKNFESKENFLQIMEELTREIYM